MKGELIKWIITFLCIQTFIQLHFCVSKLLYNDHYFEVVVKLGLTVLENKFTSCFKKKKFVCNSAVTKRKAFQINFNEQFKGYKLFISLLHLFLKNLNRVQFFT